MIINQLFPHWQRCRVVLQQLSLVNFSVQVRENTTSKLRWRVFFPPTGPGPAAQDVGRRPPSPLRVSRSSADTADLGALAYAPASNYLSLSIIIVGLGEMSGLEQERAKLFHLAAAGSQLSLNSPQ